MSKSTYDHTKVEKKWQVEWQKTGIYKTPAGSNKKKNYILDMFPYPSGSTMHVGHLEGYVGTDILSRYYRMKGQAVLHPMGWDAFGLPAENYAIKTGIHPNISTHENIKNFKRQLEISGMSYDWDHEIDTSSPEFYKWTQRLFILLFKKGLAYKKKSPVNWCPKDETVLANEQVIDGHCERCDTSVIQKNLDQWFFKITSYADRLISGLEKIDWPPEVKVQQTNWIGRSEGMNINLGDIEVFTTRPDTLEGATFVAIAADHPSLEKKYEFNSDDKDKEGEFTGRYVINPLTGRKMPVWVVNYVDMNYGTGAIMGVPYLDDRDREFAEKYHLDIIKIQTNDSLWGKIEKEGWGRKAINYHLRDWLISRQRYWGCPIPMVYCKDHGWQPVNESDLPVLLPMDVDFLPHGESPIARSKTFQKNAICPECGKAARREVDTMDTYVDSSWYFIRFVDPKNKNEFASQEKIKQWLPVDNYVGGGHVVQHLLFARFFWKVLFDEGLIDKSLGDEPFLKLRAPGWILGSDSRKMSKRWGNVVTPDDIIPKFGADTLRVYEMFMGPFDVMKPWSMTGVEGANRFLGKVWRLFIQEPKNEIDQTVIVKLHQTIKKVTEDVEHFRYNTAIAALMELINLMREKGADRESLLILAKLLAPFAPHLAEEVWVEVLGQEFSVHTSSWPTFDPELVREDEVVVVLTVNGKPRSLLLVGAAQAQNQAEMITLAKKDDKIASWLTNKKVVNTIFVPGKLINFVID